MLLYFLEKFRMLVLYFRRYSVFNRALLLFIPTINFPISPLVNSRSSGMLRSLVVISLIFYGGRFLQGRGFLAWSILAWVLVFLLCPLLVNRQVF